MSMRPQQQGLTLVELMVSMVLSLVLVLAILQVFHNSKNTYVLQSHVTVMQENGRFAIKQLRKGGGRAGYTSCRPDAYVGNLVAGSDDPELNWHLGRPGVQGFDNSQDASEWPSQFSAYPNTDAIIFRGAEIDLNFDVASSSEADSTVTLAAPATEVAAALSSGHLLLIANEKCNRVSIAHLDTLAGQVLGFYDSTPAKNCTDNLWPMNSYATCASAASFGKEAMGAGSSVMKYGATAFYIGDSGGGPSLRRINPDYSSGTLTWVDEEVVEGVENMQIRYGYDDSGDGFANFYLPANDAAVGGGWDWRRVVNVRIQLALRSARPTESEDGADFSMDGYTIPGDRYLRVLVTTVVEIKNRQRL